MRTGIFVGSFDPFTIGHDSIVRRALPLFDRLVIGVGVNERKQTLYTAEERVEAIERLYAGEPKIEVRAYSDLTVDFARREGAQYIIKGVRSVKDFEYEREQADINRQFSPLTSDLSPLTSHLSPLTSHPSSLETLLFIAEPHLASVSSSLVRELKHFGKDISSYLPSPNT